MILSKRVALGGVQLDELHERIVIRRIDPGVPTETIQAASQMGGFGQRVTGQHWNQIEASVTYGIDIPKENMAQRRGIFDAVNTWALRRGWLTTNEMPNRRLYVDKVVVPGSGDLWNWTSEYTIVFRAYGVPFWQDEMPAMSSSGISSSGSVSISNNGNMKSVVDVSFRNMSGMTINNFWAQVSGNRITLSNLGLGGSETLRIHHGTDGLLQIHIGGRSVYDRYTGADDLYISPGGASVSFSADRAGILTAECYGRYV